LNLVKRKRDQSGLQHPVHLQEGAFTLDSLSIRPALDSVAILHDKTHRGHGMAYRRSLAWLGGCAAVALLVGSAAPASAQNRAAMEVPADKARVTGQMTIDYSSRSERSSSGIDTYDLQEMKVADLFIMRGTVQRQPGSRMTYSLRYDVLNPSNPSQVARDVAILRGDLPIDSKGRYLPSDGDLRIDVVKGQQSSSKFGGVLQGRKVLKWWDVASRLRNARAEAEKVYSRVVEGKTVSIKVKNPDPLGFESVQLAGGPFSFLVPAKVTGNLDYDYELGNWLTDAGGLNIAYTIGDRTYTDKVTGSIRYVEEEGNFTDPAGKKREYTGYYDYNLRWNEQSVQNDQSFFSGGTQTQDPDAFFSSSDQTKPGIYGKVYYKDSEDHCKKQKNEKGDEECVGPTRSEVVYDLKAVGLTYQQLASWMKIEPLALGPLTDE